MRAGITSAGLTTDSGKEYEFDALIFATGFDAMTGPFLGAKTAPHPNPRIAWKLNPSKLQKRTGISHTQ
eukprot:COSAG04_NODE_24436_length_322_cov_0.681614_1_plen_68_part_10